MLTVQVPPAKLANSKQPTIKTSRHECFTFCAVVKTHAHAHDEKNGVKVRTHARRGMRADVVAPLDGENSITSARNCAKATTAATIRTIG